MSGKETGDTDRPAIAILVDLAEARIKELEDRIVELEGKLHQEIVTLRHRNGLK